MFITINPDSWYENSKSKFIGNVHCPNQIIFGKIYLQKKTFESLNRSDHQFLNANSSVESTKNAKKRQNDSIHLMCNQGIFIFGKHKNQIKIILMISFVLTGIVEDKSLYMQIHGRWMTKTVTNICSAKPAATCWVVFSGTKNWQLNSSAVMGRFVKKTGLDYKNEKPSFFKMKSISQL